MEAKKKKKKKKTGKSGKLEEEIGRGAKRENCTKGPPYFSYNGFVSKIAIAFPYLRPHGSRPFLWARILRS